jgi:phosphohistidine swiveling domain-containing protein
MSGPAERTWLRRGGPFAELEADYWRRYAANAVECWNETACVVVQFDAYRIDDGWLYVRVPDESEESASARRKAYNETALAYLDKATDHWEAVIRPEVVQRITTMRRSKPTSASIAAHVRAVETCMDNGARIMGNLHWTMVAGFVAGNDEKFAEIAGCATTEVHDYVRAYPHATDRLVRRLRKLARMMNDSDPAFGVEFDRLLAEYGRRTGSGYGSTRTFGSPTWGMEPDIALDVIKGYARSDTTAAQQKESRMMRRRRDAYSRLRAKVRETAGPERAAELDAARDVIARQARAMEDHNALMEQETEGLLRESIDALGRALVTSGAIDHPDDVVHLSLAELHDVPAAARDLVVERKALLASRTENPPPPFIGAAPAGPPPNLNAFTEETSTDPNVLVGVAASGGQATGRAVIALETHVPPDVEPGDVLVARDAGPAWTPVFPLLGGLVLDEGATWQHAALVARDYGIPAVMGTKTATTDIAPGTTVTVDGTAGRVLLDGSGGLGTEGS